MVISILHTQGTELPHSFVSVLPVPQVATCSQIRALDLRDSQFWTTPWDLTCISSLRHLTSLSLSFQVSSRPTRW